MKLPSLSGLPPRVDREVAAVCLVAVTCDVKSSLDGLGQYLIMNGAELLKVVGCIGLLPWKELWRRGDGARGGEWFLEWWLE